MSEVRKSGRRPADAGTPGRQEIWEAIRRKTAEFTVTDVQDETGAERKTISGYLGCLAAGGYVSHTPPEARGMPGIYKMLRDTGHHAPRLRPDGKPVTQGVVNEQMWRSMAILKQFTFRDLMETATVPVTEATARTYCRLLLNAGYLKVVRKADPSTSQLAIYTLIRNTGLKPPQIQRVKRVYDPNTGEVYDQGGRP